MELAILNFVTASQHALCFKIFTYKKMGATQRYLLFVSYVGTNFRGSQRQGSVETVQYVLENALKHVFQLTEERPIRVSLASRTDSGVHALRAAVRTDLPNFKQGFISPNSLRLHLNRYFTHFKSIRVLEVYTVPDSFVLQSSIIDKTYLYRYGVLKQEFFTHKYACPLSLLEADRTYLHCFSGEFDLKKAEEAASLFEGEKDYGAIVGRPTHNTRPTVCNVMSFKVEPSQPLIPFDALAQGYDYYNFICRGNRFLYRMVRRMVCLTVSVGFNILTLKDIKKLFDEPVPASWPRRVINMVPGCGLYLVNANIDLEKIKENNDKMTEDKTEESSLPVES